MQNEEVLTRDIFCAAEQTTTPHSGEVDDNGEFVFTCTTEGCGRFVKFPADVEDPEHFAALVELHEVHSAGQVTKAKQQEKLKALLTVDSVSLQNAEVEQPAAQSETEQLAEQPTDQATETSVPSTGVNEEITANPAEDVQS